MADQEPQFLELGEGERRRRIAYRLDRGGGDTGLLWLSGFLSDMASTKAVALAEWASAHGLPMLRFDYSGHGLSGCDIKQATIGDWLNEALAMAELLGAKRLIIVGSSMGGWIALLLARAMTTWPVPSPLAGLVLIAPAFDMTETLMWRQLPAEARTSIERDGIHYQPSAYGAPYPITRRLIEEGRSHLIEGHPFDPRCPVRILQGMRDPDVPWRHAMALLELLQGDDVELTLIKAAEHRQSEPDDLQRLIASVARLL